MKTKHILLLTALFTYNSPALSELDEFDCVRLFDTIMARVATLEKQIKECPTQSSERLQDIRAQLELLRLFSEPKDKNSLQKMSEKIDVAIQKQKPIQSGISDFAETLKKSVRRYAHRTCSTIAFGEIKAFAAAAREQRN